MIVILRELSRAIVHTGRIYLDARRVRRKTKFQRHFEKSPQCCPQFAPRRFYDACALGGQSGRQVEMLMRISAALCGAMVFIVCSSAAMAQSGIASVYAYSGQRTASGERAQPNGFTAAHRTLPFGTRVRVTNRNNGRSVMVRINDRGPFMRGRVIDLTPAAARALGFNGLAPVTLSAG